MLRFAPHGEVTPFHGAGSFGPFRGVRFASTPRCLGGPLGYAGPATVKGEGLTYECDQVVATAYTNPLTGFPLEGLEGTVSGVGCTLQ